MPDHAALGFMSRGNLAQELKVDEATIAKWEKDFGLPVIKIGRQRYYDPGQVREWMRSRVE